MPVASGAVSRTQQVTTLLKPLEELVTFLATGAFQALEAAEIFSGIAGGIAGEANRFKRPLLGNVTRFQFTPPRRRTDFSIGNVSLSLPSIFWFFDFEKSTAKIEVETGWVLQLVVAGVPVFVESTNVASSQIRKVGEVTEVFVEYLPLAHTLQLTQQIQVPPGTSLEVLAFPYIRIISVENGAVSQHGARPGFEVGPERVVQKSPKQSICIIGYDQELQG